MTEEGILHIVSVEAAADSEAVEEALRLGGWDPVTWEEETGRVRLDVYCESVTEARTCREDLAQRLGTDHTVTLSTLPAQDWQESWKASFRTTRISPRIVVKPSWEAYRARPADCVIEIDPGMSFGTGLHPTTRACLRFLDQLTSDPAGRVFLDVGCGSGILSIAAAKLGYGRVMAIDHDEQAVSATRENASRNGVGDVVTCRQVDLATTESLPTSDVVAANILADVLCEHASTIAGALRAGTQGHLLLAGSLVEQYEEVRAVYADRGLEELAQATEDGWRSGMFCSLNVQHRTRNIERRR